MKVNVGNVDRVLRISVALTLIGWAVMGGPVWAWVGIVPLVTGLTSVCPAYTIFGINTCAIKNKQNKRI